MIAELSGWVTAHWKLISLVLPTLMAGGGYVASVETRLHSLEQTDRERGTLVDGALDDIRLYTSETRCMLVLMNTGGDPLECVNHGRP